MNPALSCGFIYTIQYRKSLWIALSKPDLNIVSDSVHIVVSTSLYIIKTTPLVQFVKIIEGFTVNVECIYPVSNVKSDIKICWQWQNINQYTIQYSRQWYNIKPSMYSIIYDK